MEAKEVIASTSVRSCGIKDYQLNDRAGHCKAKEIDIGKHPIHGGYGCLTYERDNVLLREQLHATIQKRTTKTED
jgi:hypothetical protein